MTASARAEGIDLTKRQKENTNYDGFKDYIDTRIVSNASKMLDKFEGFLFKDS